MLHITSLVVTIILLVAGVFMAFVPMLPALSFMFVVALVFALLDGFTAVTGMNILILLCLTGLSVAVDHTAGLLGAKYGGAHTKSLLWGMLGAFVGLFTLPAFGSFIGLFVGVLSAELYYRRTHKNKHEKAFKAAGGALLGSVAGVAVNVCLAIVFLCLFLFFAL